MNVTTSFLKSAIAVLHSKVHQAVREIRDAAVDALLEAEPIGSCLQGECFRSSPSFDGHYGHPSHHQIEDDSEFRMDLFIRFRT